MVRKIALIFGIITFGLCGAAIVRAQGNDQMGARWTNPAAASMGSMINDQLANRMRARAEAKQAGSTPTGGDVHKRTPAEIDTAVRFRSTGTQLRAQAFVDFLSEGGTPEAKKAMTTIVSTLLTEYEKAARQRGKPNDLALAVTAALVYNSSIYSGTSDPDDASILEIRDSVAELAVEDGTFAAMNDRQKQELYENLVISTMLAKAGYEEAHDKGDKATMASYRELAGQTLTAVSGLPPDKIRFMPDAKTIEALRRASAPPSPTTPAGPENAPPTNLSNADYLDFDPFPDKPRFQPQKPLTGRLRKTITMADLAGTWTSGGGSIMQYVVSSSQVENSVSVTREDFTIRADGRYETRSQSRTSNQTVREAETGTISISGGLIVKTYSNGRVMKYQFVAFMPLANGASLLTLIFLGENSPFDAAGLRGNCGHAQGYVTCVNGEEWVRTP